MAILLELFLHNFKGLETSYSNSEKLNTLFWMDESEHMAFAKNDS